MSYTFFINGATDSFSNPLVLNYPVGNPTDLPRPWLKVQPLHDYANGTVFDNQQWERHARSGSRRDVATEAPQ